MRGERLHHRELVEGNGPSGASRGASGLDQFYTRPDLARLYARQVMTRRPDPDTLFVEPSAGMGAFVHPLKRAGRKIRAMDIEPRSHGVAQGDFLATTNIFDGEHSAIVVIGNPPFGKNAAMAVRFFNHAANYADEIAFIVPRTFRKISLGQRLHRNFHLEADRDVPGDAFIRDGSAWTVPCAWQIWTRCEAMRELPPSPCVAHLIDYTSKRRAGFAMRRVGYYAGRIVTDNIHALSESTHYFMREVKAGVIDILKRIDWLGVAQQTAGVRSLSKREIAIHLAAACDG
ncbi:MAG: hypothetical protein V6Z86_09595 [Hyphomicrobiales bacterium]